MRPRFACIVLALAGCAAPKPTPVSEAGARVTVLSSKRDADAARQVTTLCRDVGTVAFQSRVNDGDQNRGTFSASALNELRDELARKGATHGVYDVEEQGTATPWINRYLYVKARAFDCGDTPIAVEPAKQEAAPKQAEAAPASAPAAGGCTRDVDCKGDRICVDRVCVDPPKR